MNLGQSDHSTQILHAASLFVVRTFDRMSRVQAIGFARKLHSVRSEIKALVHFWKFGHCLAQFALFLAQYPQVRE